MGDRFLILALRSHPLLQLKVRSGFWLVLPEKSDAGFPVINLAYGDLSIIRFHFNHLF